MPIPGKKTLLARATSVLGVVVGIAGIVFVVRTLISKWDEVVATFTDLEPQVLLLSLLLGLGAMTSIGALWVAMVRHRGHDVAFPSAMSWYFTGQLGKYVPGSVWSIVGRSELATRSGIPRVDAYSSTGLSMLTTYLGALITISLAGMLSGEHFLLSILICLGLLSGYVVLSLSSLRNHTLKLIARIRPATQSLINPNRIALLSLAHVPVWVMISLSTSVTASAFGMKISLFDMLFISTSSWFIGFIVIGVPGGIGVRESVFISLATGVVGAPTAASIAITSRLLSIAVDVVGALVSNVIARSTKTGKTVS